MAKTTRKSKALATLAIDGQQYSIRATGHALDRMEQRGVDAYAVAGTVMALGPERLTALQAAEEEAIIIDREKEISVVIAFSGNRVQVVTVIDKAATFVKSNTTIENI